MKHLKLYEEYNTGLFSKEYVVEKIYEELSEDAIDDEDLIFIKESAVEYVENGLRLGLTPYSIYDFFQEDFPSLDLSYGFDSISFTHLNNSLYYFAFSKYIELFVNTLSGSQQEDFKKLIEDLRSDGLFDNLYEFGGVSVDLYDSRGGEHTIQKNIDTKQDIIEFLGHLIEFFVDWKEK